jgi:hypothetical protein
MSVVSNPKALILSICSAYCGFLTLRFGWAFLRPGTPKISEAGLERDLGWHNKTLLWKDVSDVQLRWAAAHTVSVCMVYPFAGSPIRLFGWQTKPNDIYDFIEHYRRDDAAV